MNLQNQDFILGYLDRMSYRPGETVTCMVSTSASEVIADVVRLLRAGKDEAFVAGYGPLVDTIAPQTVSAGVQETICGSYIIARDVIAGPQTALSLYVRFWPTRPTSHDQGLVTLLDGSEAVVLSVGLDRDGFPCVTTGDGSVAARCRRPVVERRWYGLRLEADQGGLMLAVTAIDPLMDEAYEDIVRQPARDVSTARTVLLAAGGRAPDGRLIGAYDGKLERPTLTSGDRTLAEWAFERSPEGDHIEDVSGCGAHGIAVNAPTRAMTGTGWTGDVEDFRWDPSGHTAIHFHADDIADAKWRPSVRIALPAGLPSGVYAVRMRAKEGTLSDFIPFGVRPGGRKRARVAFLLPTMSYQAYANLLPPENTPHALDPLDELQQRVPEIGKGQYNLHDDGSGVCMASMARPMLQYRPGYRSWLTDCPRHFSADLYLIEWLDKKGVEIDVISDHDLDEHPDEVLKGCEVLLTGSHPEYCTATMLEALERYTRRGGHLMYMGGNGFYWVTSRAPGNRDLIEVRRYGGTRTWDGEPGERHHATTGELGGLWRDRGRAPNRLTGIGMTAQGWDAATGFLRTKSSHDPKWSWVFEGVAGETFGEYGYCLGGASGDELDRFETRWGSPADGVVLASSLPHRAGYHAVVEEVIAVEGDLSAASSDTVRSDMVMIERPGGGFTFSVGSISFIGSLMWNEGENDVSRIVSNVLKHCLRLGDGRHGAT